MSNYYELLGIDKTADKKEIKKAYLQLAKIYHPDVCQNPADEEKFKMINEAYETLFDDDKRFRYDHGLTFFTTTNETTSPKPKRTPTTEDLKRRANYQAQKQEEIKEEKKVLSKRKKVMPFLVAGYVAAMIGVISFFVQRQSKLAAELYVTAKTNLQEKKIREVHRNIIELIDYEAFTEAQLIKAGIEITQNRPKRALSYLVETEKEIDFDRENLVVDLYLSMGKAYYQNKQGKEAIRSLTKVLDKGLALEESYLWMGKTYNDRLLDYVAAIDALSKIDRKSIHFPEASLLLGIAYQNNRQFELSHQFLMESLNYPEYKALSNYYLGWHYNLSMQNSTKACIYWERSAQQGYTEARYQYKRHCQEK